jgi:hypothetical protein
MYTPSTGFHPIGGFEEKQEGFLIKITSFNRKWLFHSISMSEFSKSIN